MARLTLQPARLLPAILLGEGKTLAGAENEQDLLSRAAGGDSSAFDALIACHEPGVRQLAHRLLGWQCAAGELDDVVQDVFVRLLENIRSLRNEARLSTWLTTVTLNRVRSLRRRRWVQLKWLRSRQNSDVAAASDTNILHDERSVHVRSSVRALKPADREVVVLFYLEERSVAEIASLLGASHNAIEVRLHRARAKLKVLLSDLVNE